VLGLGLGLVRWVLVLVLGLEAQVLGILSGMMAFGKESKPPTVFCTFLVHDLQLVTVFPNC
jgi:hypothetical protein